VSADVATDLTRVVLIAPQQTMEIALPARVPLADLIPVLVQRATVAGGLGRSRRRRGRGRGRGLTGEGDWVLQRLGGTPLDEDQTLASLPIYDGETLYLRPRDTQLPPAHFDDLIDGLATGIGGRRDRWRDPMTRAMFLIICAAALGACFAVVLNGPFAVQAPMAGVITLVLVLGALLCARALGDGWGGLTLGLSAVAFAALMGFSVVPDGSGPAGMALRLLCAFAGAAVTGMTVMYSVGDHRPVFLALWLATGAAAIGGLFGAMGMSAAQAAGAVTVSMLMASTFAPSAAFRLARLRLPQLPTGAADLADDIEPYPGPRIVAGALLADTYLTWLSLAVGAVSTAGVVILAHDGSSAALWLTCATSLVLMIRSRSMTSSWQRGAVLLPSVLGSALVAVRLGDRPDPLARLVVITALLTLAGAMLAFSRTMPGRRLLPYWGRLVDVGEYLVAIAMVLMLLDLFGAYRWARALAG
jgi:type VII secretion integral membrane protein EccD